MDYHYTKYVAALNRIEVFFGGGAVAVYEDSVLPWQQPAMFSANKVVISK